MSAGMPNCSKKMSLAAAPRALEYAYPADPAGRFEPGKILAQPFPHTLQLADVLMVSF